MQGAGARPLLAPRTVYINVRIRPCGVGAAVAIGVWRPKRVAIPFSLCAPWINALLWRPQHCTSKTLAITIHDVSGAGHTSRSGKQPSHYNYISCPPVFCRSLKTVTPRTHRLAACAAAA